METVGSFLQKQILIQPKSLGVGRSHRRSAILGIDLWMTLGAIAIAILLLIAATEAQAQTFQILHNFTGGADGGYPNARLSIDAARKSLRNRRPRRQYQRNTAQLPGLLWRVQVEILRRGWVYAAVYLCWRQRRGVSGRRRFWSGRKSVRDDLLLWCILPERHPVRCRHGLPPATTREFLQIRDLSLDGDGAALLHWRQRWRRSDLWRS